MTNSDSDPHPSAPLEYRRNLVLKKRAQPGRFIWIRTLSGLCFSLGFFNFAWCLGWSEAMDHAHSIPQAHFAEKILVIGIWCLPSASILLGMASLLIPQKPREYLVTLGSVIGISFSAIYLLILMALTHFALSFKGN